MTTSDDELALPDRIGRYRILRKLGEGGMGAVFEAEQDNPRRVVALKVVTGGVQSEEMRRRFELEAQVLGHLQHTAIAQVFEAGIAGEGIQAQPFFAMELIKGEPLDSYAEEHGLSARDRMELVARICDGVQHAHGRGVIHRDLKPENILVDQHGQPKILDFGIARATEADIQTATLQTDIGQIMGTVPYMSPEQALGDPNRIGPESDVYSLGIVAYQLLSGSLPYGSNDPNVIEALRVVREDDPRPISSINHSLGGDIETILGKALEKEKERRYASAADLGADIRRFLADEPILARPQSTAYQIAKFARRNRAFVIGLAGVLVALILGLIGTGMGYVQARTETARASQVSVFLQEILMGVDPAVAQGQDTTLLKSILDDTASRIEVELAGAPLAEAEIREAMATSYYGIGAFDESLKHSQIALSLREREQGADHVDALRRRQGIGSVLIELDRYDESEAMFLESLPMAIEALGEEHEVVESMHGQLGALYLKVSRYDDALATFEPLLARHRERGALGEEAGLIALNSLGVTYLYHHRFEEARELLEESLGLWREGFGEAHPETLNAVSNLISLYAQTGERELAEQLARENLARIEAVRGEAHNITLSARLRLARMLRDRGQHEEGIDELRRILELARPDSEIALDSMTDLGKYHHAIGRSTEGLSILEEVVAARMRIGGPEDLRTLTSQKALARMLKDVGEYDRAFDLFEGVLDTIIRTRGEDNTFTLVFMNDLSVAYISAGRMDRAEEHNAAALEARRRTLGDRHRSTLQSIYTRGVICLKTDRENEGLAMFGEMLLPWADIYGPEEPTLVKIATELRLAAGDLTSFVGLEPAYGALVELGERYLTSDDPQLGLDIAAHALALRESGKSSEADEVRYRAEEILMASLENPDVQEAVKDRIGRRWERLELAWSSDE